MLLCLCDFCFFSLVCKELLWGEGGPVLPVAGLVHLSAHPARCHWGHSLPLWPGLLQQLAPHVSVPATSLYLCHGCALSPLLCSRKEVCNADTVMCPLCDRRCKVWQLSDTCTYAKVHLCARDSWLHFPVSLSSPQVIIFCRWACCSIITVRSCLQCSWQCGVSSASYHYCFFSLKQSMAILFSTLFTIF